MMSLRLLLEGSRDNMLLTYLPKVQKVHPECTLSQLKTFLLNKFVNEGHIRSLSMPSNFYLVGVARYYFNGDLTTNKTLNIFDENVTDEFIEDVCKKLSAAIRVLRDKYLDSEGTSWDQPEDFGKLKLAALFKKYGKAIDKEMGIERNYDPEKKEDKSLMTSNITLDNYTYEIMYNHSDCQKYENPTSPGSWCITYAKHHYDYYTKRNNSFFVIFKRSGWENVKRPTSEPEGFPLDSYGTSLMAIQLSKKDGTVVGGTTRWNHGANGISVEGDADGKVMYPELHELTGITQDQLSEIANVWRHNARFLCVEDEDVNDGMTLSKEEMMDAVRQFNYIQICINGGQNPFLETRAFPNGMLKNPKILDYKSNTYLQKLAAENGVDINQENEDNDTNADIVPDCIDPTKVWKKCCLSVEIQSNDNIVYAIMDRGKLYHKYTMTQIPPRNTQKNKNFIATKVSATKTACYDILRHRPIICETHKFAEVILSVDDNIAVFKLGPRQFKIYSAKSGNFVKNFDYDTFEYVATTSGSYRNIISNSNYRHYGKENFLLCVIDFSANAWFYYDVENNKSIDFGDGFIPCFNFSKDGLVSLTKKNNPCLHKYGQSINVSSHVYQDYGKREYKVYNAKKSGFLSVDGQEIFIEVREYGHRILHITLPNGIEKYLFQDEGNNELVPPDGGEIDYLDFFLGCNGEEMIAYLTKKGNIFIQLPECESEIKKIETPKILNKKIVRFNITIGNNGKIYEFLFVPSRNDMVYSIYDKDFIPLRDENNEIILFYGYDWIASHNYGVNCKIYGTRYYNDKYEYYDSDNGQKNILALIGTYNNINDGHENVEQETLRENFYRLVNYII